MFPRLDLYCADPAQHIVTAGYELDDLDRDLSDLSVRQSVQRVQQREFLARTTLVSHLIHVYVCILPPSCIITGDHNNQDLRSTYNLYIPLFLQTIFGPDYYVPR